MERECHKYSPFFNIQTDNYSQTPSCVSKRTVHLLRTPTSQLCVLKKWKESSKITRKLDWKVRLKDVLKGTGVKTWLNRAAKQRE